MRADQQSIVDLMNENERLKAAGNRIIALLYRCSDSAPKAKQEENRRQADALRKIWLEACCVQPTTTPLTPARWRAQEESDLGATPPCPTCKRPLCIRNAIFSKNGRDSWLCDEHGEFEAV